MGPAGIACFDGLLHRHLRQTENSVSENFRTSFLGRRDYFDIRCASNPRAGFLSVVAFRVVFPCSSGMCFVWQPKFLRRIHGPARSSDPGSIDRGEKEGLAKGSCGVICTGTRRSIVDIQQGRRAWRFCFLNSLVLHAKAIRLCPRIRTVQSALDLVTCSRNGCGLVDDCLLRTPRL